MFSKQVGRSAKKLHSWELLIRLYFETELRRKYLSGMKYNLLNIMLLTKPYNMFIFIINL